MNHNHLPVIAALILSLLGAFPVQAASPAGQTAPDGIKNPAPTKPDTYSAQTGVPATQVLERFRTYSGPRTPEAMASLFAAPVAPGVLQQPSIVLSDGATVVRITTTLSSTDSKSPNIAFNGAQLISLKRNKADEWEIEALPVLGTLNASLILLSGTGTREIPITVAPTVPKEMDLSNLGFVAFLREAESSPQPMFDLNDDGRRDYMDDYIFTANYLARPHLAEPGPVGADTDPAASIDSVNGQATPDPARGEISQPPVSGQTSVPLAPSTSKQGSTAGQTGYQRNLSLRNQLLREQRERMKQPVVTPNP